MRNSRPIGSPDRSMAGSCAWRIPRRVQWEERKTQWLVREHKLDYLKHDCGPIVTRCTKTNHRHHYGTDASYWATLGYYRVQEQLRAAFPHLLLENCSGGGHIKDFGVVARTHYTVSTDTLSNLPNRQTIYRLDLRAATARAAMLHVRQLLSGAR